MELLEFVAVGLAAGWLVGIIRRGQGHGLLGNLAIGVGGSLIGGFLAGFLKMEPTNVAGRLVMAVAGALVFFLILGIFRARSHRRSKAEKA